MFKLPFVARSQPSRPQTQPLSPRTAEKASRLRGATVTDGLCPYCAVGCSQLIYTKAGQLIDIEGDPRSPINEGTLCPKGSNALLLAVNPHRVKTVLYRAPYSDKWETKTLDWALDQIAQRVKAARDADFTVRDPEGRTLNSVRNMGTLGGATPEHRGQLPDQEAVLAAGSEWSRSRIRPELDTPPRCPVWAPRSAAVRPPITSKIVPNSDCILFMGSNMAEAHPVGFRWPMKAKERGATLIHVDPHFSRTSAHCDLYVPIRAGSDIAFLGGIINYVLTHDRWFKEYVLHYTNAATLIQEGFQDTEDLDGLFSGLDPETGVYDAGERTLGLRGLARRPRRQDGRDEERRADPTASPGISPEDRKGVHGYAIDGGARPHDCVAVEVDIRTRRPAATRPDLAASPLRLPDPETPLLPVHAGDGLPGVRMLAGAVHARCRASLRQLGSRADERPGLRPGLDPACHRRTDDPSRGHLAAPARQHRPSGRRHPGHARPFQHPGLDGRRDPVRRPARLSAPARGRRGP